MKTLRFRVVQLLSGIILIAGVAVLAERNRRGQSPQPKSEPQTQSSRESQSQSPKTETLIKPTVLTSDRPVTTSASAAVFPEAVTQNTLLHTDLIWTFGKKEQHGWYLYDLLIGRTLNLKPDASANDFAGAIAAWQKKKKRERKKARGEEGSEERE